MGAAHAVLSRVYDPAVGSEVLSLTYAIPESSAAGIYAKGFPSGLGANHIDFVRAGVKTTAQTSASRSKQRSRSRAR